MLRTGSVHSFQRRTGDPNPHPEQTNSHHVCADQRGSHVLAPRSSHHEHHTAFSIICKAEENL